MRYLIGNAQFFGLRGEPVKPEPALKFLYADVVAPVVHQIRILLEDRKFPLKNIRYGRFENVPRLYIDVGQFHQVIFNLLSNAIKYAHHDPEKFQIEIQGLRSDKEFLVVLRDWGIGVTPGWERLIFEEGVRGEGAIQHHISGQGLGLWVVRQIVKAHGGRVGLTRHCGPTEFTIWLPTSLAEAPYEPEITKETPE